MPIRLQRGEVKIERMAELQRNTAKQAVGGFCFRIGRDKLVFSHKDFLVVCVVSGAGELQLLRLHDNMISCN